MSGFLLGRSVREEIMQGLCYFACSKLISPTPPRPPLLCLWCAKFLAHYGKKQTKNQRHQLFSSVSRGCLFGLRQRSIISHANGNTWLCLATKLPTIVDWRRNPHYLQLNWLYRRNIRPCAGIIRIPFPVEALDNLRGRASTPWHR